jgi:hypothetical protein
LVSGIAGTNVDAPAWRINSYYPGNKFWIRLGGYYYNNWTSDYYGKDKLGQQCRAEGAGFGITD